jgi:small subunit ribosomal protein S5
MADETTNDVQGGAQVPETPGQTTGAEAPAGPAEGHEQQPGRGQQFERGRGRRDDRRGGGRGRRGEGRFGAAAEEEDTGGFEDVVVKVYRCATVVKGGRRFSFAALVVVGDRQGQVGVGYGKANEVPSAVEKANKAARRNLIKVKLQGTTIPHQTMAKYGASKVMLLPAGQGTGVIAGASVRAVMELAGIRDVLTKAYGSTSPKNLVKAAFLGLQALRSKDDVARSRAVTI